MNKLFRPKFDVNDALDWLPRCTVMMGVPTYYRFHFFSFIHFIRFLRFSPWKKNWLFFFIVYENF